MNIFVLDTDPELAAKYHCDKHVVKMCLEYAQILSTVVHQKNPILHDHLNLYKPTHVKHPCVIWVHEDPIHFSWLYSLFKFTLDEYELRYGKIHGCFRIYDSLSEYYTRSELLHPTQFVKAMKAYPHLMNLSDPVEAYRRYYWEAKREFATWKTEIPQWWKDFESEESARA